MASPSLVSRSLKRGWKVFKYSCMGHFFLEYVVDVAVCSGSSMMDTIQSDDVVLTEHMSVYRRKIRRGDIVLARSPTDPRQLICKRVTGLEGDVIDSPSPCAPTAHIARGHVWLEGDNFPDSTDSNTYGPVPYGLLRSRVVYKVWPYSNARSLTSGVDPFWRRHLLQPDDDD